VSTVCPGREVLGGCGHSSPTATQRRRAHRAGPQPDRRGTRHRTRDHRLAPRTPPRTPGHEIDHQPPPHPRRTGHPRAQETTEVLLHPVRSIPAEPDLAIGLHPLPAHPPRRAPGTDIEIITWLDDCTRYALHVSAHTRVTTPIVLKTFRESLARHGIPASTLSDNGMVYTVRLAGHGRQGGKNSFEAEHDRGAPDPPRPLHPRVQLPAPAPVAAPSRDPSDALRLHAQGPARPGHRPRHPRPVRHDRVDKAGSVTLRHNSRPHQIGIGIGIGIGRYPRRTCVILLIQDLQIRVANAATGELLRELIPDPNRDYQPTGSRRGPTRRTPK